MILVGELGVPTGVPIEVALLLAGAYSIHSPLDLAGAVILVGIADTLGSSGLYWLVRSGSTRLLERLRRRDNSMVERWEKRLGGYGTGTVFAGRLLPMVRMYITIASGLVRMPFGQYLLGEVPAGTIWAGLPLAIGYFFRDDVQRLINRYTEFSHTATLVLPAFGPVLALFWWIQHGPSPRERLHRLRAVLSLGMFAVILFYLADVARVIPALRGLELLSIPFLVVWLAVLLAISAALLIIGLSDLRTATQKVEWPRHLRRFVRRESRATLLWIVLIMVAGAIMIGIAFYYPIVSLPFT